MESFTAVVKFFESQEFIMTKSELAAALLIVAGLSAAYSAESSAAEVYLRATTASINRSNDGSPVYPSGR